MAGLDAAGARRNQSVVIGGRFFEAGEARAKRRSDALIGVAWDRGSGLPGSGCRRPIGIRIRSPARTRRGRRCRSASQSTAGLRWQLRSCLSAGRPAGRRSRCSPRRQPYDAGDRPGSPEPPPPHGSLEATERGVDLGARGRELDDVAATVGEEVAAGGVIAERGHRCREDFLTWFDQRPSKLAAGYLKSGPSGTFPGSGVEVARRVHGQRAVLRVRRTERAVGSGRWRFGSSAADSVAPSRCRSRRPREMFPLVWLTATAHCRLKPTVSK